MAARTITVSALSTPNSSSHSGSIKSSSRNFTPLRPEGGLMMNSFLGEKLSLSSSNLSSPIHHRNKRQCSTVKVFLSLPTANPEKFSKENMPKNSIKAFAMAQVQAKLLKYLHTRTEALLMGILLEGTSLASQFLRANGITHSKVKEEFIQKLEDQICKSPWHPPPSESAQRALDWAIDEKLKSGESGEVTPSHMLLGIWSENESGGHRIMATLGFDDEKAKAVAEFANKDVE